MNVTMEKIDNVSAKLTVSVEENDYAEKVAKELKRLGQTQRIKGFRPGTAPKALLQKMFGKEVLFEVVNREINESLFNYLKEEKIDILGEPMLDNAGEFDIEKDKNFNVVFSIGLSPVIDVTLDANDKIPYYNIDVTEEMINRQDEAFTRRFGKQLPGEVVDETALVKGSLAQLDENGARLEGGVAVEKAIVAPEYFAGKDEAAKFIGKKLNETVVYNPWTATGGNVSQIASMLEIDKEQAEQMKGDFEFTITEILVLHPAEHNEELYEGVFGKDAAKTEEEYRELIKKMIASQFVNDSNYRFTVDVQDYVKAKVGAVELPKEFLMRWLKYRDSKVENPAEELEKMLPGLEWQLIKDKLAAKFAVEVKEEDILNVARLVATQQFAQYGMTNVDPEVLNNYARELAEKKEYRQNLVDRAIDDKLFAAIRAAVTIEEKTVSIEDFEKLFAQA